MKTVLLSCLLLASSLLFPAAASAEADINTALEEDFSAFTDGTVKAPAETNIAESGELAEKLPGWTGDHIYSAGGALLVGSTDIFEDGDYFLQTPDLNLTADNGAVRISIRLKSAEKYGNLINVYSGSTRLGVLSMDDAEWHDFTVVVGSDVPYVKLYSAGTIRTAFFIDSIKVEQGSDILLTPTSLRPIDYNGATFTARWLSVSGATSYDINVYSKDAAGEKTNLFTLNAMPKTEESSGNYIVVTVPDASKKWYYNVVAKSDVAQSLPSEESEVIRYVESLPAPKALDATEVTDAGFTANWEAVDGADSYTVTVYKTFTSTEATETSILTEDFAGITKGSFTYTDMPSSSSEKLDAYTTSPGWFAKDHVYAGGALGLWPLFSAAYVVTPALNVGDNGGVFFVDLTACLGDWGEYKTGEKFKIELIKQTDNGDEVLESEEITVDEGAYKQYGVMFTQGFNGAFVKISYEGNYTLYIDDVTVSQKIEAGAQIRSVAKQLTTTGLSAHFDLARQENTVYTYSVTASVASITQLGLDTTITSDASDEVTVSYTDGGIANTNADGVKAFSRNGQLVIIATAATAVSIYDTAGRVITARTIAAGETTVDCHGLVIVRTPRQAIKVVVR